MTVEDDAAVAGCIVTAIWLIFVMAWISFLIWAGISIVNWLVTK